MEGACGGAFRGVFLDASVFQFSQFSLVHGSSDELYNRGEPGPRPFSSPLFFFSAGSAAPAWAPALQFKIHSATSGP